MWSSLNPHIFHEVLSHSTKKLCVVLVSSEKFWLLNAIRNWVFVLIGQNWLGLVGAERWCSCTHGEFHYGNAGRILWLSCDLNLWPPRSLDLTPLNFYLWHPPNIGRYVDTVPLLTLCLVSANDKRLNYATGKCKSLPSSPLFTSSVNSETHIIYWHMVSYSKGFVTVGSLCIYQSMIHFKTGFSDKDQSWCT